MCPAFPLYSIAPANLLEHGSHIFGLLHIYFIFQPLLRHVLSYSQMDILLLFEVYLYFNSLFNVIA